MEDCWHLCFLLSFAVSGVFVPGATGCQSPESCLLPGGEATRSMGSFGRTGVSHLWPWMVAISDSATPNEVFCGGTLIAPRWILTSARCMLAGECQKTADSVHVRLGFTDGNNLTTAQDASVEEIKVHEHYNPFTSENDIALLWLTNNVSYNEFVRPIDLPPPLGKLPQEPPLYGTGKLEIVLGWAMARNSTGSAVPMMKEGVVKVVRPRACYRKFKRYIDGMLCTAPLIRRREVCEGDSGGPLMLPHTISNQGIRYTQIGIVSKGYRCSARANPAQHTRVSKYIEWINEALKNAV